MSESPKLYSNAVITLGAILVGTLMASEFLTRKSSTERTR